METQETGLKGSTATDQTGADATALSPNNTVEQLSVTAAVQMRQPQPPSYASPTISRTNSMSKGASPARSPTPRAPQSPGRLQRASSSLSHGRAPSFSSPNMQRKLSISSLRSVTSSPAVASPRRPPSSMDFARASSTLPTAVEESPMTASSVATEFFTRELLSHEDHDATSETVVIIHDACYGHRFSRQKTTKTSLSMIVERPERILACALGVSAAYVRLGSRHKGGNHAPHPDKPPHSDRPFRIRKSSRSMDVTSPAVVAVHGSEWMDELKVMCDAAGAKLSLGMKELARPDAQDGAAGADEKPTFHEGDLYLCSETLSALQGAAGGVCDAVDAILSGQQNAPQRAFVAVRPPGHHCSSDWPSGFCWINNVHIAIEYASQNYGLTHAVIFDFDLHHGDGSQEIAWDKNAKSATMPKNAPFNKKTSIGYYSMHDINSYPCEWGDKEKVQNASLCIDNAHGQSIWNVHLQPWSTMDEFWALYETKYLVLLEKARAFLKKHTERIKATPKQVPAKAVIFISAGFDASEWEGAGMQRHAVNVPTEFYARFTKDVVKLAQEDGTAVDGRVISVLEGGYSDRALSSGVLSHLSGLCQQSRKDDQQDTHDMVSAIQRMNIAAMGIESAPANETKTSAVPNYDTNWWHESNLTALENYITPPPPPPVPKRTQRTAMPTYATPTESFTHKVVDPLNFKRSMSGTMRSVPAQPSKSHNQPAPEVDWIVATHELSKLLIPTDRQTRSCKPEELAAPRVKKERLSGPAALPIETGRQLRGRKPKTPDISPPPDMDTLTEGMRRQTISDLPISSEPQLAQLPKRATRRSSQFFSGVGTTLDHSSVPPVPAVPGTTSSMPSATVSAPKRRLARAPTRSPAGTPKSMIKQENAKTHPTPLSTVQSSNYGDAAPPVSHIAGSQESRPGSGAGTGPKRITLKLGSREESERKQLERLELEKKQKKDEAARARPKKTMSKKGEIHMEEKEEKSSNASIEPSLPPLMSSSSSPPGARPETRECSVPQLALHVPTPKSESRNPLSQQANGEREETSSVTASAPLTAGTPSANSSHETDELPTSPPIFTPTFMSQAQSPVDNRSRSTSAGTSSHEGDENYRRSQQQHVQYEFKPQPQSPEQIKAREAQVSGTGVGAGFEAIGGVEHSVRQSLLAQPSTIPPSDAYRMGTSRPSSGTGRERLPVFSSTSAIPFAPTSAAPAPYQPISSARLTSYGFGNVVVGRVSEGGLGVDSLDTEVGDPFTPPLFTPGTVAAIEMGEGEEWTPRAGQGENERDRNGA